MNSLRPAGLLNQKISKISFRMSFMQCSGMTGEVPHCMTFRILNSHTLEILILIFEI